MKSSLEIISKAIQHFESFGFKKGRVGSRIQMRKIDKEKKIVQTFDFNISGSGDDCFLYSIKGSINFIELSNIFTEIWNRSTENKIGKYAIYGIYPRLAQNFSVLKLEDYEIPRSVQKLKGEEVFETLANQFVELKSKFFDKYEDLEFIKENLKILDDDEWTEMFGPETVFLKLYFNWLESRELYEQYNEKLKPIIEKQVEEYISKDFKRGAEELWRRYELVLAKLSD